MHAVFSEIEEKIGYRFRDKDLLKEAFTHATYAHLHGGKDNERVEFLGDTVLQFAITDYLYKKYPEKTEGELTRLRAKLVCEESLLGAVENYGLGKYLRVEGSKANVGKKTYSSLFETVTGAIYLDGGYEQAKEFIFRSGLVESAPKDKDAKSLLQEYLQGLHKEPPKYASVKEGKDNAPTFRCQASALGKTATGAGKSKKSAEQEAAKRLLTLLRQSKGKK
ncbi:MAG: ribonuclease III [Clostridia bacterium]|nr:ribonuclease III [Clostridia bacterium]